MLFELWFESLHGAAMMLPQLIFTDVFWRCCWIWPLTWWLCFFSSLLLMLSRSLSSFITSHLLQHSLFFYFRLRLHPPVFVLPCFLSSPSSSFRAFRRRRWPPWPLTPSLWACLSHRLVEEEAAVTRRGQINLNQNASMSPTSRSASGTRTCVRCSGCESLIIKLLTVTKAFYSYCNSLFSHFQQFGKILDVEIIFNERGSKVSSAGIKGLL